MENCSRYDNVTWLSYARRLLDSGVAAEMKTHSESCEECRAQLDFSLKLAAVIDLNSMEPPDEWISEAAARFESEGPAATDERLPIFGEMVFDSYLHDQQAVRSNRMQTRHLIFELSEFEVDLVLEYSGSQIRSMIGHMLSKRTDSPARLQDFRLDLKVAGRRYSTKPNQFGEFSFTVDTQITDEPLELQCTAEEGPCLVFLIPC